MQISKRVQSLQDGGAAWAVFFKARQMVAAGEAVTELTIGEPDVRTAPAILDAMAAAAHGGQTGYSAIPGEPELRAAVAERVRARTGVATGPENVLITPGGQAGLFAAHAAVLDPGDKALMVDPYYATYPGTILAVGGEPVAVTARPELGFLPRGEDIAAAALEARSLLINTPNNPTGAIYPRTTLEEIAAACEAAGLWLISDEVYDTQIWEGEALSPRALPGMAERTLSVGSLSKSHAMTGSRIGWVVGPEEAIAAMTDLAINTTYGVPGFIQTAAVYALAQGTALEAEIAAPFRRRREIALRLIGAQNVVKALPAQGAMYVLLDIRATGLSGQDFAEKLLAEEMIAVMPGESFGAAAAGHVRVALTIDDARFEAALARLLDWAAKQAG